ncbi:unnamed protein product [Amoebophrya sp. A120]|nr:unnamed protein product [Amoebophrya sp. A120]|eukprot:GSA120T00007860001.1
MATVVSRPTPSFGRGALGQKRLLKEYKQMQEMAKNKEDMNGIYAEPSPDNLFVWYFLFEPEEEPYSRGQYLGKVVLPEEYPFKPPELYMLTPNGRFEVNTKICTTMSSYHPETWKSIWTIRTVLLGLLSYFHETGSLGIGCTLTPEFRKKQLAEQSWGWNKKHVVAGMLFADRLFDENPKVEKAEIMLNPVFTSFFRAAGDFVMAPFKGAALGCEQCQKNPDTNKEEEEIEISPVKPKRDVDDPVVKFESGGGKKTEQEEHQGGGETGSTAGQMGGGLGLVGKQDGDGEVEEQLQAGELFRQVLPAKKLFETSSTHDEHGNEQVSSNGGGRGASASSGKEVPQEKGGEDEGGDLRRVTHVPSPTRNRSWWAL